MSEPKLKPTHAPGPDWPTIVAAHARIAPRIHRTPVLTSASLDEMAGARLFFKCENFQKTGSFKIRGASNAIFSMSAEEIARGIVTLSSGNHGAAVACAASWRGVASYIVMPRNAPAVKCLAVEAYGGRIIFCEPTVSARAEAAARVQADTGAVLVHPYDDDRIIAGQATAAKELLEEESDLDAVFAPVSGGGLLSGTCLGAQGARAGIRVYGCEPERADDAYRSLQSGTLQSLETTDTIADGLRASLFRTHIRDFARTRRGNLAGKRSGDYRRHAPSLGTYENYYRAKLRCRDRAIVAQGDAGEPRLTSACRRKPAEIRNYFLRRKFGFFFSAVLG